ncbi:MAG: hypothetical protein D8M59_16015 [Planctomycetes bacterium]|nr:hypothetical protein [Planctomycetota bacterium]
MILRDKDANSGWTSAADGTLEERRYLCQNWRADVSAIVSSGGYLVEWAKYSPYGTPFGLPGADTDSDGDCDATDITQIQTWIDASSYDVRGDVDLDGDVDATDKSTAQSSYQGTTSGWNDLTAIGNRKGYAGYEWDSVVSMYHVRNHVLHPVLGRWTRRDPLGEIAFKNSTSANISKPCSECDDTSGGIEQQSDRNPSPGTGCMVDGQIPLYSLSESDRPSLMAMESAVTRIGVSHPVQLSYKYGANLYESHVSQPCSMQDASGLGCTGAQKIACGCSSWLACCKCRTGVWTPGGAPEAVQPCIMTFPPPMAAIPGGTCTALVPMVACQSCTGRTWWSGKICTKCRRVPAAPPTVTATGVIVNSWNGMPQCRVVVGGKTLDC